MKRSERIAQVRVGTTADRQGGSLCLRYPGLKPGCLADLPQSGFREQPRSLSDFVAKRLQRAAQDRVGFCHEVAIENSPGLQPWVGVSQMRPESGARHEACSIPDVAFVK